MESGSRFIDFLDFQSLTTKFILAKESKDQSRKGIFLMSSNAKMSFWGSIGFKQFLSSNSGILSPTFFIGTSYQCQANLPHFEISVKLRHQTEDAAVPGSNPAPPQSPERGQDI
jgi:hypothetical protein